MAVIKYIFFKNKQGFYEIVAAIYNDLLCISDEFMFDASFQAQCEGAGMSFQGLYIPLHEELLVKVLSQLPDKAILAIDSYELEDCGAFHTLERFRQKDVVVYDGEEFRYCYRINKTDLSVFIDLVRESDFLSFLIHFVMMDYQDDGSCEPWVVVYDSSIFCVSDKIVVGKEFIKQAGRAHLYIQELYI